MGHRPDTVPPQLALIIGPAQDSVLASQTNGGEEKNNGKGDMGGKPKQGEGEGREKLYLLPLPSRAEDLTNEPVTF